MIIFEIRDAAWQDCNKDEKAVADRLLGYLFYYKRSKRFYVELLEELTEWEVPPMFYGHVKKHIYSIDSEWSMKWVRQRIVPVDRQNIGAILKENHMTEYDDFKLLMLSEGRCAQDEEYIVKIGPGQLSNGIKNRLAKKVNDVLAVSFDRVFVFFKDDTVRVINIKKLLDGNRIFANILSKEDIFLGVKVSPGGNGIEWDQLHSITAELLYSSGEISDIRYCDLEQFLRLRTIDTNGLAGTLRVSRQYINQLVKKETILPLMECANTNIFAKADVEKM